MRHALAVLLLAASSAAAPAPAPQRVVAVTFDDLPGPAGALVSNDVETLRATTRRLLDAFAAHAVPVTGFVNEGKLFVEGETPAQAEARVAVLRLWVEAGHELGNHTYSHRSLNRVALEEFQQDVVRGEPVTRRLLAGRAPRWFRHPFLHTGLELDKRRAFEAFLAGRGYRSAPVTVDTSDYVYASAYADALRRGDRDLATRLGEDYLRHSEAVFAFAEDLSRTLVGREIRQVLLLHANALNADRFSTLARLLEKRGYRFVSLEEALRDEAYALPDTWVGAWGVSWLHRWETSMGRPRSTAPDPPPWVTQAYEAARR